MLWKRKKNVRCAGIVTLIACAFISALVYDELTTLLSLDRTALYEAEYCREDLATGQRLCRPSCEHGFYSLPGMTQCEPWLDCSNLNSSVILTDPSEAEIKGRYGNWIRKGLLGGHVVDVNTWKAEHGKVAFLHSLDLLRFYQPTKYMVQLIGVCGTTFITEQHHLGSVDNLDSVLHSAPYTKYNNLRTRLKVCVSYLEALNFLHTSPIGTRILCDSITLERTLRHFLITSDLLVVIDKIIRVREVDSSNGLTTHCDLLKGDFLAPEQLWPFDSSEFQVSRMSRYDEKSDIWKIPDVCKYFLRHNNVHPLLSHIHLMCKEGKPSLRPSASEVLQVYRNVLNELESK